MDIIVLLHIDVKVPKNTASANNSTSDDPHELMFDRVLLLPPPAPPDMIDDDYYFVKITPLSGKDHNSYVDLD
jgi:hypothetical protein